eukprot:COSAG06_NODE_614_length_13779_cov_89.527412_5_plen_163_part_00
MLARVGGPRPRAELAAQGEAACAAHRELVVLPVELLKRLLLLAHNLRWWGRRTQDPRRWPSQDQAQRSGPRAKYAEGKRGDARSSGQRRRRGAPRGETPTSACPGSRASPRSSWLQAVSGLAEEAVCCSASGSVQVAFFVACPLPKCGLTPCRTTRRLCEDV